MYVKEDIILPHTITFYDLIVNKAMGKSLVQCYLNVTSVLLCKDGLVCMAI
jgi:hypothetical protein